VSTARAAKTRDVDAGPLVRVTLIALAVVVVVVFALLPAALVFAEAFAHGLGRYLASLSDPDARAALWLSLGVVAIAVPLNTVFGVAAAHAIARGRFRGRRLLLTLVDLPLTVSPVVAGLMLVLLFGVRGLLGQWLAAHDLSVVFATPGIVLATVFVTFPYVAREVIALQETQAPDQEEAAVILGASWWTVFWRVTLWRIRWALLYGVALCAARALGEFGAVSIVSGHVRGQTNTLPLHIEVLYGDYDFTGAFAVSTLLVFGGFFSVVVKAAFGRAARARASREEP
jgi:sulfate/thiosulfate transport system permease protein